MSSAREVALLVLLEVVSIFEVRCDCEYVIESALSCLIRAGDFDALSL